MTTKNGKYYIIRTQNAGVWFGQLSSPKEDTITLYNARRLWFWSGAASISQIAMEGVKNPKDCKFTVTIPDEITLFGVIEILPCTDEAIENIKSVPVWKI